MKLLHLTHSKNIKSIIQNGLLPSYIEINYHYETFKRYLKDRNCIYTWSAETYKNDKFIRDMIYTKLFIHPRNKYFEVYNNETDEYFNFKKPGSKLYGDVGKFLLLEIDTEDIISHGSWEHVQEPGGIRESTTVIMDDKYAHNDKDVIISPTKIDFENIKIVEEVHARKYKNDTLGFSFRKY